MEKLKFCGALRACVYTYILQLGSFRVPMLWFIDLAVVTCHIQYTFLSLCQFCPRENRQNTKNSKSAIFVWYENGRQRLLGAQSINTARTTEVQKQNHLKNVYTLCSSLVCWIFLYGSQLTHAWPPYIWFFQMSTIPRVFGQQPWNLTELLI